jgi:hypothetical protein
LFVISICPTTAERLVRTMLAGFVVCLVVAGSEAYAGCGDYLLPPVAIAKQQQAPTEYRFGRVYGPHHERPCSGPACRRNSSPEWPTPVVPPTVSLLDQQFFTAPSAAVLSPPHQHEPLAHPADDRWAQAFSRRLERPPIA